MCTWGTIWVILIFIRSYGHFQGELLGCWGAFLGYWYWKKHYTVHETVCCTFRQKTLPEVSMGLWPLHFIYAYERSNVMYLCHFIFPVLSNRFTNFDKFFCWVSYTFGQVRRSAAHSLQSSLHFIYSFTSVIFGAFTGLELSICGIISTNTCVGLVSCVVNLR